MIRDESHRFAVTYHRKIRSRRTITTELTRIQGVGAKRARQLLRRFGSVRGVREASLDALIDAVGTRVAERIRGHLHTEANAK